MAYSTAHRQPSSAHTGRRDLAADPRFATRADRTRNVPELYDFVGGHPLTAVHGALAEILRTARHSGRGGERLEKHEHDPHLSDVGFFASVKDGEKRNRGSRATRVRMQGSSLARAMPPRLGRLAAEVLREVGLPRRDENQEDK